jgi:hypothetical protein
MKLTLRRNLIKRECLGMGILLAGLFFIGAAWGGSQTPTFHSFLTKDLIVPNPATQFTFSDRISLLTVWNGLTGTHNVAVLWINPQKNVYSTTEFTFKVPPGNISSRSMACCLSFRKRWFFLSNKRIKLLGSWKARLFLDGIFLAEYSFYMS